VDKLTIKIIICDFQVGGLIHLFDSSGLFPDFFHPVTPWETPSPLHGRITLLGPRNVIWYAGNK